MPVQIPDDSDFSSFKDQCLSTEGWMSRYNKGGVTVWCREEESKTVQKLKAEKNCPCLDVKKKNPLGWKLFPSEILTRGRLQDVSMRIVCKDVTAETLYDVLHDTSYRRKWDTNMIDTYDIGRLTVNADVGYYSWKCPTPLKNRDFVTMRSWLPLGSDYLIINYSVKHPQHPPKKDYVRAVSLLTGYLIQSNGPNCSTLYYLTQVDPRGSLPKWVVNRVSQFVAPKAMRKIYKASLKYPDWKRKHNPNLKPWMYPEQNTLPCISAAELTVQRADSLENIDESSLNEEKTHHSDDEET